MSDSAIRPTDSVAMKSPGEETPAGDEPPPRTLAQYKGRIVVAFWLLGMCNNYIYVIMLSAAHDVISKVEKSDNTTMPNETTAVTPVFARKCNEVSTGAILLADIIPTLVVKLICPFLPFLVHVRLGFSVATGILALVLVGLAESMVISLLGVCFASFNSGLGEITLLAYSTLFPLFAVAAWSSGTGGAGLVGAFAYAGMTEAGLTPEMTLFISILFPLLFAFSFWVILKHPSSDDLALANTPESPKSSTTPVPASGSQPSTASTSDVTSKRESIISEVVSNLKYIPELLPYMIPVGLVYYLEYLINSGLFELLVFENTTIAPSNQFRWYNVMYQVGVFVSRSSVSWIHFEKVWVMSVFQGINVVILTLEAIYGFIPNVWIMFVIIFWEGLLGGAAYVNTFYNMSYKIPKERRLFALSIASVADTFGIVSAGFSSFPVHDAICNLPYNPVFRWPAT